VFPVPSRINNHFEDNELTISKKEAIQTAGVDSASRPGTRDSIGLTRVKVLDG
jgi:hypothetical protein